jgi:hypothetical protein
VLTSDKAFGSWFDYVERQLNQFGLVVMPSAEPVFVIPSPDKDSDPIVKRRKPDDNL